MNQTLYRLNQFISRSGVTSRRKADILIESGKIKVNGKIVKKLGTKVSVEDKIEYNRKQITIQRYKYLVLNKPKNFITTLSDEKKRKTVLDLINNACAERLFPVGRLDKNTTGVLLFTNDGDLSQKLIHPKHKIKKEYHVSLNKKISMLDFEKIKKGIDLEDGKIKVDEIRIINNTYNKELLLTLHSGRNRIVRRIFEFFDYEVLKLDRILFAGISKKNTPRGKWRFLNNKEIGFLKMK
ncbi:rRNA pseudouridine synthase [Bacteroidota bacterium]|nr:rRNA pseudouridine synthase [Bacteroidota bacterium]